MRFCYSLALAGAFGALLCAQTSTPAPTPAPAIPLDTAASTGMIGLADGQTARLSVLNLTPAADASTSTPIVPCTVALAFVDANGALRKSATVTVPAGEAQWLDADRDDPDLAALPSGRAEIRGTVTPVAPPAASAASIVQPLGCRVLVSLEIFDDVTGRTEALTTRIRRLVPTPVPVASGRR